MAKFTVRNSVCSLTGAFPTFEEAELAARFLLVSSQETKLEIHRVDPHPVPGVSHYNPVSRVTPETALSPKECLASLQGAGGGDVRASSCNPKVYPFVPVLIRNDATGQEVWKLEHPEIETDGWYFETRELAELVAQLVQRTTGGAARSAAHALVLSAPLDGRSWASRVRYIRRYHGTYGGGLRTTFLDLHEARKILGLYFLANGVPAKLSLSFR